MKKALIFVGLGTAFLAVSLWVWLSNGKSAKAVRAKFRLGGALLTLTGLMAMGGCQPTCYEPAIECYDPAPLDEVYIDGYNVLTPMEVSDGDEIVISTASMHTYDTLYVTIFDAAGLVLQEEQFAIETPTSRLTLKVDVLDYVGEAELVISGRLESGEEVVLGLFNLNITDGQE